MIGSSNAPGAKEDVENITSTFKELQFAIFEKPVGASKDSICRIVQAAAKYTEDDHECFVFYYAGHGGSTDGHGYITPRDGNNKLYIKEGIVDYFSPKRSPLWKEKKNPKNRYRLFFLIVAFQTQSLEMIHLMSNYWVTFLLERTRL